MSKNKAFVASTLPLYWLNKNIETWGVEEVVIASHELHESYKILIKSHHNLKLSVIPANKFLSAIVLFWKVGGSRLFSRKVVFFHECCWVTLDLIVKFIKPNGYFFPQVAMTSHIKASKKDVKNNGIYSMLNLSNLFTDFYMISDRDNVKKIVHSCKNYPKSIKTFKVSNRLKTKNNTKNLNEVLIIVGSNNCSDKDIFLVYESIVKLISLCGFVCHIKDHPRNEARLNVNDQFSQYSVKHIDPSTPVEFLTDNYALVVGIGSIGLVHFGGKSISVIDTMECMSKEIKNIQKKHLLLIPGGELITFVKNIQDIQLHLNKG